MLTWVAVYASITSAQALLGDATAGPPLPVCTLLLTGAVVPLVVYLLVPGLFWINGALGRRRFVTQRRPGTTPSDRVG